MRERLLITIWFFLMIAIGSAGTYALFNYQDSTNDMIIYSKSTNDDIDDANNKDGTYKQIKFTNYVLDSKTAVKLTDKELLVEIKNQKVYIDGEKTDIENDFDEIYIVDIDQDKTMEIISRSIDETISPNINTYHIYKYKDIQVKEILKISILGTIDTMLIKEKEVKIEYIPFESATNTKKEEIYMLK